MKLSLTVAAVLGGVMLLSQAALAQRATVGIYAIEYKAKESSETRRLKAKYGQGSVEENTRAFIDMLNTALIKTNKVHVIERDRLDDLWNERGLQAFQQALATGKGALPEGGISEVDYIVTGAITEFGFSATASSFGKLATASESAAMAVDIRIVDAKTGRAGIAETVRATETGGIVLQQGQNAFGGGGDGGLLLGAVMRKAANNVTGLIVTSIYPIRVINVGADKTIVLNYGNALLNEGNILDVFSVGEAFVDPDTGETLGSEEMFVGKIKVTSATAKFSKAALHQEDKAKDEIEKGMIARLVKGGNAQQKAKSGVNLGGVKLF